jgi:hypothetical protein
MYFRKVLQVDIIVSTEEMEFKPAKFTKKKHLFVHL